jgi:hypothetical protein
MIFMKANGSFCFEHSYFQSILFDFFLSFVPSLIGATKLTFSRRIIVAFIIFAVLLIFTLARWHIYRISFDGEIEQFNFIVSHRFKKVTHTIKPQDISFSYFPKHYSRGLKSLNLRLYFSGIVFCDLQANDHYYAAGSVEKLVEKLRSIGVVEIVENEK